MLTRTDGAWQLLAYLALLAALFVAMGEAAMGWVR